MKMLRSTSHLTLKRIPGMRCEYSCFTDKLKHREVSNLPKEVISVNNENIQGHIISKKGQDSNSGPVIPESALLTTMPH